MWFYCHEGTCLVLLHVHTHCPLHSCPWEPLVCFGLRTLRVLYEWNQTACNLWRRASFHWAKALESHPGRGGARLSPPPSCWRGWAFCRLFVFYEQAQILASLTVSVWVRCPFLSALRMPMWASFFKSYCAVVRCSVQCLPPRASDYFPRVKISSEYLQGLVQCPAHSWCSVGECLSVNGSLNCMLP